MPRTAVSLLAYGLTWRGIEREAVRRMDAAYGAWMRRMVRGCGIWCVDAAYGVWMWHMVRGDAEYGAWRMVCRCGVSYAGMTSGVWRKILGRLTGILFFD